MRRLFLTGLMVVLWVVGCGRQPDYFPLAKGAVRVMKVYERRVVGADTSETTQVRVVEAVLGEKEVPGLGKVWVVEAPLDSGRSTRYFYQMRPDSVLKFVPGRGGRPEQMLFLLMPLKVGKKWYESDKEREVSEVVANEPVAVAAGTFPSCFKVVTTAARVDLKVESWLAPGVGVVKRDKRLTWMQDSVRHELFSSEELVEYRVVKPRTR